MFISIYYSTSFIAIDEQRAPTLDFDLKVQRVFPNEAIPIKHIHLDYRVENSPILIYLCFLTFLNFNHAQCFNKSKFRLHQSKTHTDTISKTSMHFKESLDFEKLKRKSSLLPWTVSERQKCHWWSFAFL